MNENDEKRLGSEDLEKVAGGQWTPADWFEGYYTVIEDAPGITCGECHATGQCQKVNYVIIEDGKNIGGIFYRCGVCGAICGCG